MLNPRAIATLGIGFSALQIAYLGLWPDAIPPDTGGGVSPPRFLQPLMKRRLNRDDQDLLEIIPIVVEVLNARR